MPRRKVPEPFAQVIGERIRVLLDEKGWTLERLGDVSRVRNEHLQNITRGLTSRTVVVIERIAEGLGVPMFMLFVFPEDGPVERLVDILGRWTPKECEELLATVMEQSNRTTNTASALTTH